MKDLPAYRVFWTVGADEMGSPEMPLAMAVQTVGSILRLRETAPGYVRVSSVRVEPTGTMYTLSEAEHDWSAAP